MKKMNMRSASHRVAVYGIMTAVAMVFGYIEHLLPLPIGIYGIKAGLANIVPLTILELFGAFPAAVINLVRIVLSGILFGNTVSIAYSLAGGALSLVVMMLIRRIRGITATGVGIVGGVAHNIGQLIIAVFLTDEIRIAFYLPVLIIAGAIAGLLVGVIASMTLQNKNIKKISNI
ncbi:MAG: Gx transporter family protein [Clostridia bacterium]|nr:Gx transporter family protein [Clostridia bacterium]